MRPAGIAFRLYAMLVVVAAVAVIAHSAPAQAPGLTVQGVGFQTPESILYDATDDVYLVSNINGNPAAADGNGFISRIGPEGQVLALKWIDGLEALPGGVLLVSSWGASAVFRVAADGRAEAVVSNVRSPADIGYDRKRNRVLIPLFQDNRVVIQRLR